MESQVTLDGEVLTPSNNPLTKDVESGVASSSPDIVDSQPAKKQTRQWAAWTRQEEEGFFDALQQFGKNFEKITCRVQSKNKDQVRHYYYHLARRLNKLLGPGFSFNAKNSLDTNAAMLQWWSSLKNYSSKASKKLYMKPRSRRFKKFISALMHQLLKDREENIQKRPSQGENSSSGSPTSVSVQGRPSGHDNGAVKEVIDDSQNIQKVVSGNGSSVRHNVNTELSLGNNKVDLSAVKAVKQLQSNGLEGFHLYNHRTSSNNQIVESSLQPPMKLKLQLFPIDEATRRALEKDELNPHLELTVSAKKKISSVLNHLNRKWENSRIASGELMLFPYGVQRDKLAGSLRWRRDTAARAADVYATIGSAKVFRMRYGWFSNIESASVTLIAPSTTLHVQEDSLSLSLSLNMWIKEEENGEAAQLPSLLIGHVVDQITVAER